MRLIGAGLPRTGTLSQKVALEMLGIAPCYHMVNVLADLDEAPVWRRGLEGETVWPELFRDCRSTVDWPGSFFYRELAEFYPDAKVLLSVRDADCWERSMRETIWGVLFGEMLTRDLSRARCRVDTKWRGYIELMEQMWIQSGLIPDGTSTDSETMKRAMGRFNAEVQATIPAERLLVWAVGDGWEPLCEFLEVPVPDTPFPHLNESKVFSERIIDGALLTLGEWRAGKTEQVAAT